jgi:hypothetical protein
MRFSNFRPSQASVERANRLLKLSRENSLDEATRRELDRFEQAELLMRLVKAPDPRKPKQVAASPMSRYVPLQLRREMRSEPGSIASIACSTKTMRSCRTSRITSSP